MDPNDVTHVCTNQSQNVAQLSLTQSRCTIYRVHKHLQNVNIKAYEPEIIAIGPYHRDNNNLKMMDDQKLRYLFLLLRRKTENVEKYISAIGPLEPEARKCYAEPISLNATEFTKMLVLDGCFIIDLVRKCNMIYLRDKRDPIFQMSWMINSLQRDLMLFENQVPFFILCKLFDLIEVPNQHSRLIYLLLNFFNSLYPGKSHGDSSTNRSPNEIKHLLDLIHSNFCPDTLSCGKEADNGRKRWLFINSANQLRKANVKFKQNEGVSFFDIRFKDGTMMLPPLTIEGRTESLFRNLVAYEQYVQDTQTSYVTDYVNFLHCLIDSSGDVAILSRYGIIDNRFGGDEAVAKVFNRLKDSIAGPGSRFIYAEVFDNVNKHCNKRRNRWMAKLRAKLFE